jgi:glycosyltransferase involved in cell wall biosynthesis
MKVIICEYHPWDSITRIGNHHYAKQFLNAGWEVVWISHPVSPLHALKPENALRIEMAKSGPARYKNGLTEITPLTLLPFYNLPILKSRWVLENSLRYTKPLLQDQLTEIGFESPDLLWITDTTLHALTDIIDPKCIAVRIADDNVRFSNMPASLKWAEDKLCSQANLLFVTSSPLEERFRSRYSSKLRLLRNGVDFEHFQGTWPRPQEYAGTTGPVAVYVGAMEQWFTPEWVEALAKAHPEMTVVLIGRADIDISRCTALPNVRYIGTKAYNDLPPYLAHADLGIIPFKRTSLVDSVSPLKLFEFFASGLPVVSARWTELERLDSPALLASTSDEFVRMVTDVIRQNWKASSGARFREYAKENSWEKRFESAMEDVKRVLDVR